MSQKLIYFPGLNGIRAIAASVVLFFHIDQYLRLFELTSLGFHKSGMAGYGVILFFCLSGFLITYLLIKEKEKFGKVDLKKFYIRRVLRIWPLYYLAILLGSLITFYLYPNIFGSTSFIITTLSYSLLASNIAYFLGFGLTPITPLWSVSAEEQFYAFWPFVINKSNNILRSLIIIFFVFFTAKVGLYILGSGAFYFFKTSAFDSMAIGVSVPTC